MQDPLSNFKSSAFVSQYKSIPLQEFQQSAGALQERAIANRENLDKLDMLAYQIETDPVDQAIKDRRLQAIRDEQERIAGSGAYEMAGDLVRQQAKDFAKDKQLQTAKSTYANYSQMMEKAASLNPAQQLKVKQKHADYVAKGGVGETPDEFGRYNTIGKVDFYEDQQIQKKVSDLIKGWKSDKTAYAQAVQGGYIREGSLESADPKELREAALAMLQADPSIARQINDEARALLYEVTGDLSVVDENFDPNTPLTLQDGTQISAADYVRSRYADPMVARESFEKRTAGLKGDPTFGSGGLDKKLANMVLANTGSQYNFANIPTGDEYQAKLLDMGNLMANYDKTINDPSLSEEVRQAAQTNKDALISDYSRIKDLEDQYFNNLTPEESFAAKFARNLELQGISSIPGKSSGRLSSMISSSGFSTGNNVFDNDAKKYSTAQEIYNQTYQEVYEKAPEKADFGSMFDALATGRDQINKFLSSEDFDGYMDEVSNTNTFAPQWLNFNETIRKSNADLTLQSAIKSGNIEIFGTNKGPITDTQGFRNTIEALELMPEAVSAPTAKGSLIRFTIPVLTQTEKKDLRAEVKEFVTDYEGQEIAVSVKGVGAGNVNIFANALYDSAVKQGTVAQLPGAVDFSGQLAGTAAQIDTPYRYTSQIESLKGENVSVPLVENGVTLAKVYTKTTPSGERVYQIQTYGLDKNNKPVKVGASTSYVNLQQAKAITEGIYKSYKGEK